MAVRISKAHVNLPPLPSRSLHLFLQNHETSFKGRALQAVADSWCKIQVITRDKCYTQFSANANTILSLTSQALRYIGIQRGYNDSLLNRKKNHWLSFEEISVKSEKEAEGG
jgi:hypothetical protein